MTWRSALLYVGALAVCASGCAAPPNAPAHAHRYEACGVCFESSAALTPVRGLLVDSCAFQFRGEGIVVGGEHSGFAGEPDEGSRDARGVVRLRTKSADSGNPVVGIWIPEGDGGPPLYLSVEYAKPAQARVADGIVSSTRRCGTPPM